MANSDPLHLSSFKFGELTQPITESNCLNFEKVPWGTHSKSHSWNVKILKRSLGELTGYTLNTPCFMTPWPHGGAAILIVKFSSSRVQLCLCIQWWSDPTQLSLPLTWHLVILVILIMIINSNANRNDPHPHCQGSKAVCSFSANSSKSTYPIIPNRLELFTSIFTTVDTATKIFALWS